MKKIIYLLLLLPHLTLGQTTSQNYIKVSTYTEPSVTTDGSKAKVTVNYFNGLGMPSQFISGKMGGTGLDLITHIEYDNFGRQVREYLPYQATTSDLSYDNSAAANVITFYNKAAFENTANPYGERLLEDSPLDRLLKIGAPGTDWKISTDQNNDHSIKYMYLSNTGSLGKLTAVATWNSTNKIYDISLINSGSYEAGQLYRTIRKDENSTGNFNIGLGYNGRQIEEYKDKNGRIIFKKSYYSTSDDFGMSQQAFIDIHYVYDQFSNLTYVIPSNGFLDTSADYIDKYGYQYKYDARNRLVEQKLPGKDWEYLVYDKSDRLVASGPVYSPFGSVGNTEKGWMITKYDVFGRAAYTGWYPASSFSSVTRNTMQSNTFSVVTKTASATSIDNVSVYYTNVGFPTTSLKLLTVNYYDNYTFPSASAFPSDGIEGESVVADAKGLQTGSWVRIITTAAQTFAEVTTSFYNTKSRVLRIRSTNSQLGGYTQIDSKLNFKGEKQYVIVRHKRTSSGSEQELVTRNDYTYNTQDRLLTETHSVGSLSPELMSSNTYNSVGQLSQKRVGRTSSTYLQAVNFSYNVRGWLKGINDINNLVSVIRGVPTDLFAFEINYNRASQFANVPANYNGNITETTWRTSSDNIMRRYSYSYDDVNRLRDSYYQMPNAVEPMRNSYDESIKYDFLGNITRLKRNGGLDSDTNVVPIDNLKYTYTGNRLDKIVDSTNSPQGFTDNTATTVNDFTYDSFGNLVSDLNKGIQSNGIIYNHLNLPITITVSNGTVTGSVNYTYNAIGTKLKKTVVNTTTPTTTTTDYLKGFQYTNSVLDFFPTSEGYVKNTTVAGANNYNYVYQYKDHVGNIRLSYTVDPADNKVKIMEENHYYPFGLKHQGYSSSQLMIQPGGGFEPFPISLTPVINPADASYKYKYNGKELQDELSLNLYDYGARNYDPTIGRWMNIDPLAGKWHEYSPYNYTLNNPVYFVDPNGMDVYLYYYVRSDNDDDNRLFANAALTRAAEMAKNMTAGDAFKVTFVQDLGKLEEMVESDVAELSPTYGGTREVGIFSHSGVDGPIGSLPASKDPLYIKGDINSDPEPDEPLFHEKTSAQLSIAGWSKIDFNWINDGKSRANFYGCRSAVDPDGDGLWRKSFTTTLSSLPNFKDVRVGGQSSSSYPSLYTNVRETNSDMRDGNFAGQRVYMVGGGDLGATGRWLAEPANPMIESVNGVEVKTFWQAGVQKE